MEQLLLGGQLALRFRRDLADEDVPGLDEGADPHDAALVEVRQRLLPHVGDVAGELLLAELGLADLDLVLLDVDRGEDVVLHQALRHEDRVLVVEAVPGHERHEEVLAEGELAALRGGAVREELARHDLVADLDHRAVVLGRALVHAAELLLVVLVVADDDHPAVHVLDGARALGEDGHVRVGGHGLLHARADDRHLGDEERHRLALHVRAHQRAVRVVVLEERDERRGHADDLLRRDVHVVHLVRRHLDVVAVLTGQDALREDLALRVDLDVDRGHDPAGLLVRTQEVDLVGHDPLLHLAVGRGEEAVLVEGRVERERRDQADVGAFRRLDRAEAAVVGQVHVADVEARALAVEAARAEGREATLVGQLAERVRLVHDLAQLRPAEEVVDRAREGLGVDQRPGGHRLRVLEVHALLGRAAELEEALAELLARQLGDRAHAAVAQVVDVVDLAGPRAELEDVLDRVDDVLGLEDLDVLTDGLVELAVQAEAADATQAVALDVEELLVEQLAGLLDLRRVTRAQAAVDLDQRVLVALHTRLLVERVDDEHVEVLGIGVDDLHLGELAAGDLQGGGLRDRHARGHEHLAGLQDDDVPHRDAVGDLLREGVGGLRLGLLDDLGRVELTQERLVRAEVLVEGAEERDRAELAALVDADAERLLLRDVELHPGAALRDDPARVQGAVRGRGVDQEVDAGRAVELAHDDALGAVDHELAAAQHDRDLAEVDLLLDGLRLHEAEAHLEGVAVAHAELAALVDVVARTPELVADVLEAHRLVVRVDREDLAQQGLETLVLTGPRRDVRREEGLERPRLDLHQVGKGNDLGDPAEVANLGRLLDHAAGAFNDHVRRVGFGGAGRRPRSRAQTSATPGPRVGPRGADLGGAVAKPWAGPARRRHGPWGPRRLALVEPVWGETGSVVWPQPLAVAGPGTRTRRTTGALRPWRRRRCSAGGRGRPTALRAGSERRQPRPPRRRHGIDGGTEAKEEPRRSFHGPGGPKVDWT